MTFELVSATFLKPAARKGFSLPIYKSTGGLFFLGMTG